VTVLRLQWRRVRGRNADLFFPGDERVYKLFRRGRDSFTAKIARDAFKAETQAYTIAIGAPSLTDHIPEYFGIQIIERVLDVSNRSCGYRYLLDCCYATEQLTGGERAAFGVPDSRLADVEELLEEFERLGVRYAADSSVFGWEPKMTLRFIDIATYDANVRALISGRRLTRA